jgi:1,4-alpha-glucan branching enzyme
MGGEFGQAREWNHDQSLDWHVVQHSFQAGLQKWLPTSTDSIGRNPF